MKLSSSLAILTFIGLAACNPADQAAQSAAGPDRSGSEASGKTTRGGVLVPYERFTLDNGLTVLLHVDRSDPVVAVNLTAHVGSSRETEGRTGFAHMFEHLLFLESENLGKGGLDRLTARVGGSGANGSTNRDRTNYLQTVPSDALEKMIWAEADKLGWFINTVTDPVLAKEKQVVKNEKRQSNDNQPYGHNNYVIDTNMYPPGHPYSWEVIGTLADLDAATLDDVKTFYRRWYTPNNTVLTIAGDIDTAQTRAWVERYFAEIPRGEEIPPREKMPAGLTETKSFFHEDNYATLPQLTLSWPTVPAYHDDANALAVLGQLLTDGKSAPLNEVLIDEEKLTSTIFWFDRNSELAGQSYLLVRAFEGVDLDAVDAALARAFARFEEEGVDPRELERVKTQAEVGVYNGIGTVLGKTVSLAQYEIFAGDAGYLDQDIANLRDVSAEDVMRVYERYIKDRPHIRTSFVPRGAAELALEGATRATVIEEPIVQGAEEEFDASVQAEYERTPSRIDRQTEPPYGPAPQIRAPSVWNASLSNGLRVYGVSDDELPLVRFTLSIDGGHWLDALERPGVAALTADLMTKGTANRTTAELESAIELLGASINVSAGAESFTVSGSTLARNFDETMELMKEVLLEPRWDEEEFALAKARFANAAVARMAQPNAIANGVAALVLYGEDHVLSRNAGGTPGSVAAITLDDLQAYYADYVAPNIASFRVVGDVARDEVNAALASLEEDWAAREVSLPEYEPPAAPAASAVYFYDVPNAAQSVFRFTRPGPKATDADFYPASVMNYILGGGGFASRLTQELREGKGYTYGIGSGFVGTARTGNFTIFSGVRANVTLEAADLVKQILEDYPSTFTDGDLEVTKSFLSKSQARAFESLGAKLGLLGNVADYGWEPDYVVERLDYVRNVTREEIEALAERYIRPGEMFYVIVGDAATQAPRLEELGFGAPIMINDRFDAISE